MILTPYAVQKLVYQLLLSQLTVDEAPKDLVEVRTIDESPRMSSPRSGTKSSSFPANILSLTNVFISWASAKFLIS
jgi:hypothetical protein